MQANYVLESHHPDRIHYMERKEPHKWRTVLWGDYHQTFSKRDQARNYLRVMKTFPTDEDFILRNVGIGTTRYRLVVWYVEYTKLGYALYPSESSVPLFAGFMENLDLSKFLQEYDLEGYALQGIFQQISKLDPKTLTESQLEWVGTQLAAFSQISDFRNL